MNFWGNLLEHFKSNGAWLCMPALLVFFGLVIAGSILHDQVPTEYFIYALSVIGIFALALVWRAIHRTRRRERYKASSLSRDEMNKARSKLVNRNKI